MAQQFDIIPTGTALGADITDFDIKIMDQEDEVDDSETTEISIAVGDKQFTFKSD